MNIKEELQEESTNLTDIISTVANSTEFLSSFGLTVLSENYQEEEENLRKKEVEIIDTVIRLVARQESLKSFEAFILPVGDFVKKELPKINSKIYAGLSYSFNYLKTKSLEGFDPNQFDDIKEVFENNVPDWLEKEIEDSINAVEDENFLLPLKILNEIKLLSISMSTLDPLNKNTLENLPEAMCQLEFLEFIKKKSKQYELQPQEQLMLALYMRVIFKCYFVLDQDKKLLPTEIFYKLRDDYKGKSLTEPSEKEVKDSLSVLQTKIDTRNYSEIEEKKEKENKKSRSVFAKEMAVLFNDTQKTVEEFLENSLILQKKREEEYKGSIEKQIFLLEENARKEKKEIKPSKTKQAYGIQLLTRLCKDKKKAEKIAEIIHFLGTTSTQLAQSAVGLGGTILSVAYPLSAVLVPIVLPALNGILSAGNKAFNVLFNTENREMEINKEEKALEENFKKVFQKVHEATLCVMNGLKDIQKDIGVMNETLLITFKSLSTQIDQGFKFLSQEITTEFQEVKDLMEFLYKKQEKHLSFLMELVDKGIRINLANNIDEFKRKQTKNGQLIMMKLKDKQKLTKDDAERLYKIALSFKNIKEPIYLNNQSAIANGLLDMLDVLDKNREQRKRVLLQIHYFINPLRSHFEEKKFLLSLFEDNLPMLLLWLENTKVLIALGQHDIETAKKYKKYIEPRLKEGHQLHHFLMAVGQPSVIQRVWSNFKNQVEKCSQSLPEKPIKILQTANLSEDWGKPYQELLTQQRVLLSLLILGYQDAYEFGNESLEILFVDLVQITEEVSLFYKTDPSYAKDLWLKIEKQMTDWQKAFEIAVETRKLRPGSTQLKAILFDLHRLFEKIDIKYKKEDLLKIDPYYPLLFEYQILSNMNDKKYDEVIKLYEEGESRIDPMSLINLGALYQQKGDLEKAIKTYQSLMQYFLDNRDFFFKYSKVNKKTAEILQKFQQEYVSILLQQISLCLQKGMGLSKNALQARRYFIEAKGYLVQAEQLSEQNINIVFATLIVNECLGSKRDQKKWAEARNYFVEIMLDLIKDKEGNQVDFVLIESVKNYLIQDGKKMAEQEGLEDKIYNAIGTFLNCLHEPKEAEKAFNKVKNSSSRQANTM